MNGSHAAARPASLRDSDSNLRGQLRKHTGLSVIINALVPAGIIWALRLPPPTTIVGHQGILPGMILASGLATLLMTLGVTLAVRADVGAVRVTSPPTGFGSSMRRILPAGLLLRALGMGFLAMLTIVPCFLIAISALPILPLSNHGFLGWNVVYGTTVGVTMTPLVVLRALTDTQHNRDPHT